MEFYFYLCNDAIKSLLSPHRIGAAAASVWYWFHTYIRFRLDCISEFIR